MKLTVFCVLAFIAGMYAQQLFYPPVYHLREEWHVVRAGDTMWSIACDYFDRQDKIKNLNEWQYRCRKYNETYLRKGFLHIGDVVRIPLEVRVK